MENSELKEIHFKVRDLILDEILKYIHEPLTKDDIVGEGRSKANIAFLSRIALMCALRKVRGIHDLSKSDIAILTGSHPRHKNRHCTVIYMEQIMSGDVVPTTYGNRRDDAEKIVNRVANTLALDRLMNDIESSEFESADIDKSAFERLSLMETLKIDRYRSQSSMLYLDHVRERIDILFRIYVEERKNHLSLRQRSGDYIPLSVVQNISKSMVWPKDYEDYVFGSTLRVDFQKI